MEDVLLATKRNVSEGERRGGKQIEGIGTNVLLCPPRGFQYFNLSLFLHIMLVSDENDLEMWRCKSSSVC